MPRLFTGLAIPAEIGLALSLKRLSLPGARWIDPQDYHITLRFIGDVDRPTANDIDQALLGLEGTAGLEVTIDQLGVFGGDKPRSLYAGVVPEPGLMHLQAVHERVIQRVGLAPEGRKFTPHVTLARLRGIGAGELARALGAAGPFAPLRFRPEAFVLYSSKDSVGGGPYVVEATYALGS